MLNEARSLVESLQSLLNRTTTSGATATSGTPLVTAATATVATPVPTAHAGTSQSLSPYQIHQNLFGYKCRSTSTSRGGERGAKKAKKDVPWTHFCMSPRARHGFSTRRLFSHDCQWTW